MVEAAFATQATQIEGLEVLASRICAERHKLEFKDCLAWIDNPPSAHPSLQLGWVVSGDVSVNPAHVRSLKSDIAVVPEVGSIVTVTADLGGTSVADVWRVTVSHGKADRFAAAMVEALTVGIANRASTPGSAALMNSNS